MCTQSNVQKKLNKNSNSTHPSSKLSLLFLTAVALTTQSSVPPHLFLTALVLPQRWRFSNFYLRRMWFFSTLTEKRSNSFWRSNLVTQIRLTFLVIISEDARRKGCVISTPKHSRQRQHQDMIMTQNQWIKQSVQNCAIKICHCKSC